MGCSRSGEQEATGLSRGILPLLSPEQAGQLAQDRQSEGTERFLKDSPLFQKKNSFTKSSNSLL
jgi:hypothetical protein